MAVFLQLSLLRKLNSESLTLFEFISIIFPLIFIVFKDYFPFVLLQNLGYILHVVHYILKPFLHLDSLCLPFPNPYIVPPQLVISSLFSISVSMLLFCYIH